MLGGTRTYQYEVNVGMSESNNRFSDYSPVMTLSCFLDVAGLLLAFGELQFEDGSTGFGAERKSRVGLMPN